MPDRSKLGVPAYSPGIFQRWGGWLVYSRPWGLVQTSHAEFCQAARFSAPGRWCCQAVFSS